MEGLEVKINKYGYYEQLFRGAADTVFYSVSCALIATLGSVAVISSDQPMFEGLGEVSGWRMLFTLVMLMALYWMSRRQAGQIGAEMDARV